MTGFWILVAIPPAAMLTVIIADVAKIKWSKWLRNRKCEKEGHAWMRTRIFLGDWIYKVECRRCWERKEDLRFRDLPKHEQKEFKVRKGENGFTYYSLYGDNG